METDISTLLENCYDEDVKDMELDGLIADYDELDINRIVCIVRFDLGE